MTAMRAKLEMLVQKYEAAEGPVSPEEVAGDLVNILEGEPQKGSEEGDEE